MSKNKPKLTLRKIIMRMIVAMIVFGSVIGGCSQINKKFGVRDNHFLEELAEDFFEKETGIEVDLTPDSPEQ
jgi:ABC-type glycerol-3-phosphate transport system substrate-binding protein